MRLWAHPAMLSALAGRDLGMVLRLVRDHAGWTQTVISGRTGIAQSQVSPIMAGSRRVTTLERMERIADGLGMPDESRMTLGLAPISAGMETPGGRTRCTCGTAGETGECSMHRRKFLTAAGSILATAAVADPAEIASVVRRRTTSNVDDLTLDDMEVTVDHLMREFPKQPHHELSRLATTNWAAAERMLDGWQNLGQRQRLVELAGQLSYYTGRLHYSAGRYPEATQFATLTQRYAAETENLVLRHSSVALHSAVAFFHSQNYARAAQIMRRGHRYATDYTRARGLAYAARSYSALGDRTSTLEALQGMRDAMVDLPSQPGEIPFTQASALLFTTGCLRRLGDGPEASSVGRETVTAYDEARTPSHEEHAGARIALALALTTGDRPDPEQAASVGAAVVSSPDPLNDNLIKQLSMLREALRPWRREPGVAVLSDQISAHERLARA
jgi:hypothetical protein